MRPPLLHAHLTLHLQGLPAEPHCATPLLNPTQVLNLEPRFWLAGGWSPKVKVHVLFGGEDKATPAHKAKHSEFNVDAEVEFVVDGDQGECVRAGSTGTQLGWRHRAAAPCQSRGTGKRKLSGSPCSVYPLNSQPAALTT